MKLPNMALIFAIIIIPILLIFSLYVGYQIQTVTEQSVYDTRLVSATRDAITALEMNTFGDSTKDNASSTRRNIQASVNTFTDSFASNFGVTGYDNSDVLSYVPALLFTMYDGYYIYAPTTDEQDLENTVDENYANYILKPYVYYSARYKSDVVGNKYDVVINYSLDNYITITGTVDGEYISKSGYLIDTSTKHITVDANGNVTSVDDVALVEENLYEKITFFLEDANLDGDINYTDGAIYAEANNMLSNADIGTPVTLTCRYCYKDNEKYYYYKYEDGIVNYNNISKAEAKNVFNGTWFKYNQTGRIIQVNPETLGLPTEGEELEQILSDDSAIKFYQEAYEFTNEINDYFKNGITANTMIKPNGISVTSDSLEPSDPYYIFGDDMSNVLNATGDKDVFTQHKLNVMKATITENLNVAISSYSNAAVSNFYMPEISETEWEKILTNISMVSFVQGMPIGFKTYNNYAIVTSTNNEMYVGEDSIYYVANSASESDLDDHHKAECSVMQEVSSNLTGYASTEFDKYTVNYLTEYQEGKEKVTRQVDHYLHYYKHHSLDCYGCIVSKANIENDFESDIVKSAKLHAVARIRYNQYKVTQYINNKTQ